VKFAVLRSNEEYRIMRDAKFGSEEREAGNWLGTSLSTAEKEKEPKELGEKEIDKKEIGSKELGKKELGQEELGNWVPTAHHRHTS
jgi:hypothetical protein